MALGQLYTLMSFEIIDLKSNIRSHTDGYKYPFLVLHLHLQLPGEQLGSTTATATTCLPTQSQEPLEASVYASLFPSQSSLTFTVGVRFCPVQQPTQHCHRARPQQSRHR